MFFFLGLAICRHSVAISPELNRDPDRDFLADYQEKP